MRKFASFLLLMIAQSIWWYLLHSILAAINADRLLWFLYYVYVPVAVITSLFAVILRDQK